MNPEWICRRHNARGQGTICPMCAREVDSRALINTIEARVTDQGDELRDLRRQLAELRGIVQALQLAHNRLAAHVRPDPELLP